MRPTEVDKGHRLAVSLTGDAADVVREFAAANNITPAEAVRRAIAIQRFIDDESRAGSVFLMRRNGSDETDRIQFVFG